MNTLTESTKVTNRNVYRYLRLVAPDLKFDDLEMIYRRGGESVTFFYGQDRILKVPRNTQKRRNILSEFGILSHLAKHDLPVVLPKPVEAHPEGLYAIFERIDGEPLTQERAADFDAETSEHFASRIGEFLSFLHTHSFPAECTANVQIGEDEIATLLARSHRKIKSIDTYAKEPFDTSSWKEQLVGFASLESIPTLTHADMTLNHIFVEPTRTGIGVIDFADAQIADPHIDLAYLRVPPETLDRILSHYNSPDPALLDKIAFSRLCSDIHRQYRAVKKRGK